MLALNRIFRRDYAALFPWADRRNGSADVDAHRGGQRERSIDARVFFNNLMELERTRQ